MNTSIRVIIATLLVLGLYEMLNVRPVSAVDCETLTHHKTAYSVCRIDLTQDDLRLYWQETTGNPLGSIKALEKWMLSSGYQTVFATNSGIYDKRQRPLGLHVMENQIIVPLNLNAGEGNFYMKPNGVFGIGPSGASIIDASQYSEKMAFRFAAQSGPLLVRDGMLHPAFRQDSVNRFVRNGVGVISPDKVAFVMSTSPVNFFELASFFRDKLRCQNALYLDGFVSQMVGPNLMQNNDKPAPLVGIWAAVKRVQK